MRRPAPLRARPLSALVLAALLLPLASPAHAEDPLPRLSGVSPADLFTVQQSRPLEGFSVGVGGLTQLLHLPPTAQAPADYRIGQDLLITGSLGGYVQLDLGLPTRIYPRGQVRPDGSLDPRLGASLGGLRLAGKFALPRLRRTVAGSGLGLSLTFGADLPTAVPAPRQTSLRPGVVVDGQWAFRHGVRLLVAANLGARLTLAQAPMPLGASLTYGGGAKLLVAPRIGLSLLVGADGAVPRTPTLGGGAANAFGGLDWYGASCYRVAATGGARLGEPQGVGWFVSASFARLWGGECRAARGSSVAPKRRAARNERQQVTSTRPKPSTPLLAGPVPSDFLQTAISQELRALVIHAGLFQTVPDLFSRPVSPQEAQYLLAVVLGAAATWRNLGPRKVLCRLLAEIAASPKGLGLSALGRILASYRHVLIVRGDGYFARVLDGEAIQRAGNVEFDPALGELRAGTYGVGALYLNKQGGLYGLDEETWRTLGLVGELSLEHGLGPIDNVLDGVEDSLGGMVRGLGELIREPVRTIEGLKHLPEAAIALIRSSPAYWERFKEMPQGDQIREVSRLVTELVLLKGSIKGVIAGAKGARAAYLLGRQALNEAAQAAAKGMAASALSAGRRGSVLVLIPTLTADGRLIWEAIAVPVEQLAEAAKLGLGAGGELGAGGSFILQMGAKESAGGSGASNGRGGRGTGTPEKTTGQAEEGGTKETGSEPAAEAGVALEEAAAGLSDEALEALLEKTPNWEQVKDFIGRRLSEAGTPEFQAVKAELESAGYQLDVLKDGRQPFRLRRLGDKTKTAPLTVTREGVIALKTGEKTRISVPSRCKKEYLEWTEELHGPVARAEVEVRLGSGYQLHHLIPDAVAQTHRLVQEALRRLKGYTIDRGSNIIDMPSSVRKAEGRIAHRGSHPHYDDLVTKELDRAMKALTKRTNKPLANIDPSLLSEVLRSVEDKLRKAIDTHSLPPGTLKELQEEGGRAGRKLGCNSTRYEDVAA